MSPFRSIISAGLAAASSVAGETITYARASAGISIEISGAVRGSTNWETDSPIPHSRVGDRSVDWIVERSQLTSGGTLLEPQRGDTITTASGETFRVMPMSSNSPLWKWVDRQGQTRMRIFSKERD